LHSTALVAAGMTNQGDTISNLARAIDLAALGLAFVLAAWLGAGDARQMPFSDVLALRIKLQNFIAFSSGGDMDHHASRTSASITLISIAAKRASFAMSSSR
jgi:hypothetical protein